MRVLKRIMLLLVKSLIILVILSAAGAIIAYSISVKTCRDFLRVLEYTGFALMIMGALSIMGNMKLIGDYSYNIARSAVDMKKSTFRDIEMNFAACRFTIITGLSGILLLLICLILWEY
ncbi:MAG: hypothetical protein GX069_00110 [Tissierellia bacterium]|nr:hypothetical protein [Tissierellia bacterium]